MYVIYIRKYKMEVNLLKINVDITHIQWYFSASSFCIC